MLEVLPYGEYDAEGQLLEVLYHPTKFFFKETAWGSSGIDGFITVYPVEMVEGGVLLPERSNSALFYFYDNDKITFLPKEPKEEYRVVQSGYDLLFEKDGSLFEGDIVGLVDSFRINKFTQGSYPSTVTVSVDWSQIAAIACRLSSLEGNGYLLYDHHQLYMSYEYDLFVSIDGVITGYIGTGFFLSDLIPL